LAADFINPESSGDKGARYFGKSAEAVGTNTVSVREITATAGKSLTFVSPQSQSDRVNFESEEGKSESESSNSESQRRKSESDGNNSASDRIKGESDRRKSESGLM